MKTEIKKFRIDFRGRIPKIIKDDYLEKEFVLSESRLQSLVVEMTEKDLDSLLDKMNSISDDEIKVVGVQDLTKTIASCILEFESKDDAPSLFRVLDYYKRFSNPDSALFTISEIVSLIQEDGDYLEDVTRFLTTNSKEFNFQIDVKLLNSKINNKINSKK